MRSGAPVAAPPGVVEQIRNGEANGFFDDGAGRQLSHGDPVRIVEGPFADLCGRFDGLADQDRVLVLLDLVKRQVKVSLPMKILAAA